MGKMERLDQAAIDRVSGRAWDGVREQFLAISGALLDVNGEAGSELTTIYVKFTVGTVAGSPVFAVVWIKSSRKVIVGLSLPESVESNELGPALPGTTYQGLTKYFSVAPGEAVPAQLPEWATLAYQNVVNAGGF
jgi:hypothetical protein